MCFGNDEPDVPSVMLLIHIHVALSILGIPVVLDTNGATAPTTGSKDSLLKATASRLLGTNEVLRSGRSLGVNLGLREESVKLCAHVLETRGHVQAREVIYTKERNDDVGEMLEEQLS
jgi:hypothetical protein